MIAGHCKFHPEEYKISVTELLGKASILYSRRMTNHSKSIVAGYNPIAKSTSGFHRVATNSNESLKRNAAGSFKCEVETADFESIPDEQKWILFKMKKNPQDENPHGFLSKILFNDDPKIVEGWDIMPNPSFPGIQILGRSRL